MNRFLAAAVALAITLPVFAQAEQKKDEERVVASINGEVVTRARLDAIWDRVPPHLQKQYESVGGKKALLDNYLRKRLLLQHAFRNGFAKPAEGELDVVLESQLFDRYVREAIAPTVLSEATIREFYEENRLQFRHPPQARIRHIVMWTDNRPVEDAREKLTAVMRSLSEYRASIAEKPNRAELLRERFGELAGEHSEEEITAVHGGLVGWVPYDKLDDGLVDDAKNIAVGTMSGILKSEKGVHLLFIEDRREAGVESYENVADDIREFLMPQYMSRIIDAVNERTSQLLATAEVSVFAENLN
jgi:peptidyl-prolyl cis-trans isomerase C